jgi:GNAT superfamily N-acetyltransferase
MLTWRYAQVEDCGVLGAWNHRLIQDEGHRNPMTVDQLTSRMAKWIEGEYKAALFLCDTKAIGYALFKPQTDLVHLRQFFIVPESRRKRLGSHCFDLLRHEVWPHSARLTVDVLCHNAAGMSFWRSLGYQDYCLTLEILPHIDRKR